MSNVPPPPIDYAAPQSKYAPCPNCGAYGATKVGFTWWGGVLGPALMTHVKCPNCRTCYNGKTGRSNSTAIAIYTIVGLVLGIGVVIFVMLAQ